MVVLLHSFKNIFFVEELRRKLFFTLIVFAVFRFGVHVTIPGVDIVALQRLFMGATSGFLSYLNLFSGGALQNFSIFALGISPYITSSIVMQIFSMSIPQLEALAKEGEYGRRIINQYTRYLTFFLSIIQGFGIVSYIESQQGLVLTPGWSFRITAVLFLCIGTMFVMWLGEQINAHGIGNGSSMIIFAGITAGLPAALIKLVAQIRAGQVDLLVVGALLLFTVLVISCVIFLEKGERKVPVQYAKRVVGNKLYGGQSSYIPIKLNPASVVPVIFSTTALSLPLTILGWVGSRWPSLNATIMGYFSGTSLVYNILNAGLIVFFAFTYTWMIFNPVDIADNLRKSGGAVPGIRPGQRTAQFFEYLLGRICFPGSLYLAVLAIVPTLLANGGVFPMIFSGVSLLIVVGVALDTSAQVESYLIERRYEGFLSSGRLKGRYGR